MDNKNLEQQDTFKKYLTSEVKFVIGIIGFVVGVVAPYYDIKQDVALIKENHYTHIENLQSQIKEMKEVDLRLQQEYVDLLKALNNK